MTSLQEETGRHGVADAENQRLRTLLVLAAGLAHEVNNALGAALGFTEIALEEMAVDDPVRPDLAEVLGALERSTQLLRQFMAVCRPQAGATPCLALNPVVKEAGKQSWLGSEGRRLTLEVPNALLWVRADPVHLLEAVLGLCDLAAAPEPGRAAAQGLLMRLEKTNDPPEPGLSNDAGWAWLGLQGALTPPGAELAAAWRRLGGGLQGESLDQGRMRLSAWLPLEGGGI